MSPEVHEELSVRLLPIRTAKVYVATLVGACVIVPFLHSAVIGVTQILGGVVGLAYLYVGVLESRRVTNILSTLRVTPIPLTELQLMLRSYKRKLLKRISVECLLLGVAASTAAFLVQVGHNVLQWITVPLWILAAVIFGAYFVSCATLGLSIGEYINTRRRGTILYVISSVGVLFVLLVATTLTVLQCVLISLMSMSSRAGIIHLARWACISIGTGLLITGMWYVLTDQSKLQNEE